VESRSEERLDMMDGIGGGGGVGDAARKGWWGLGGGVGRVFRVGVGRGGGLRWGRGGVEGQGGGE